MSSLPGLGLEDFVMWAHDLIVDGNTGANKSLQIAEALGVPTRRIRVTGDQFQRILDLYEPYREDVERRLSDFDEAAQSWRDYASYSFGFVPDEVWDAGHRLRQQAQERLG